MLALRQSKNSTSPGGIGCACVRRFTVSVPDGYPDIRQGIFCKMHDALKGIPGSASSLRFELDSDVMGDIVDRYIYGDLRPQQMECYVTFEYLNSQVRMGVSESFDVGTRKQSVLAGRVGLAIHQAPAVKSAIILIV